MSDKPAEEARGMDAEKLARALIAQGWVDESVAFDEFVIALACNLTDPNVAASAAGTLQASEMNQGRVAPTQQFKATVERPNACECDACKGDRNE